jgi:hypothetical protein
MTDIEAMVVTTGAMVVTTTGVNRAVLVEFLTSRRPRRHAVTGEARSHAVPIPYGPLPDHAPTARSAWRGAAQIAGWFELG